jgi:hypothetical protein
MSGLTDVVTGLTTQGSAADAAAGAATGATTGAATGATGGPVAEKCPGLTDKLKKEAMLKKYCDIIDGQQTQIIDKFNESFDNFLKNVFEKQSGTELSKFIENILFTHMKKSILDNYYVQNSFVADILKYEKIKNMLQSAYYNKPNKNKIFKNFISRIKDHLKKPDVPVAPTAGGGDAPDDINKLMEWFPTEPDYKTNQQMVYLVKNKIGKYLNDDQVKKNVIDKIVPKIHEYISETSNTFINGLSEHLKIRILYALLTSKTDRRVQRKFKGALDKAETNGALDEAEKQGGLNNFEKFMETIIEHFGGSSTETPNNAVGGKSQDRKQKKTKKGKSRKNHKKTTKKTRH